MAEAAQRQEPGTGLVAVGRSSWRSGVAEGGTGRRPHARPGASLPSALTQYRNSSPIAAKATCQGNPMAAAPEVATGSPGLRPAASRTCEDGLHEGFQEEWRKLPKS